ncbi:MULTISPECIES: hypothetical protein [Actinoalloteichus]|uniref:Uncharacterized protein n=1 Tax=Actinoalloteichus fjordicus TaxID=1612552 RepID=A0AAC9LGR1_9PSEU|nr:MULTISPECIES: hypothetical protein [Actinoalloteichus]APU16075.1 hypothetical protein UA74_20250 [Actinoalloteichus fjordicus]APU22140.1 hypothetical protein UA75_20755 [Actinoalloteichus sp. GBA129-24]
MGTRDRPERSSAHRDGGAGVRGALRRWMYLPYGLLTSAVAVAVFLQAVLAGQFLSGTFGSLQRHQDGAALTDMLLITAILVAIPLRWPGRGPRWPIFAPLGLLSLTIAQNVAGFERVLTVHIPLGVTIILLAALLAVRSWRLVPHQGPAPETGASAETPADADRPRTTAQTAPAPTTARSSA